MSSQTVTVPAATDWIAASKVFAIEAVFVASTVAVLLGRDSPDIIQIVWTTGLALAGLRATDQLANIINVRSFLSKPGSGVVPQAQGTPLLKNGAPPA